MTIYRIEVTVAATMYIRADSPKAARLKARAYVGSDTPEVSGAMFDSPELPEVSLSPAMCLMRLSQGIEEVDA